MLLPAIDDQPYREIVLDAARDLYTPSLPGMLMRSLLVRESGLFRLARRTCSLFSVEIKALGSWGRILLFDEHENLIFYQPSTFTGSFVIDGCAFDGLYLLSDCGNGKTDALLTINWREADAAMV
jgi:hypothetical protein